jgi:O-antigen ligase
MSDDPDSLEVPQLDGLARPVRSPLMLTGGASDRRGSGAQALNEIAAVLLALVTLVSAVPLGSGRPLWVMGFATLISAVGTLYGVGLLMVGGKLRRAVAPLLPEALIWCVFTAALGAQLMPLVPLWPGLAATLGGEALLQSQLSLDPGETGQMLIAMLAIALLFYLTAQVAANRARARLLMRLIFAGLVAYAAYGLLALTQFGDTLLGFKKTTYLGFATGTFVNRNSFATFLAMGLALGAAIGVDTLLRPTRDGWVGRALRVGIVVACEALLLITLLATGSRMGATAAVTGLIVVLVPGIAALRPRLGQIALILVGLVLAALLVLALFGESLLSRAIVQSLTEDARVELHRGVWAAIWQRPWFGYGGGSFASVFPAFSPADLAGDLIFDRSHSTYLALWFEMGLVVGSLPMLMVLIMAGRLVRRVLDGSERMTALGALGVIGVVAVHSLMDFSLEIYANALLFTFILALGVAGTRATKRSA